VVKISKGLDLGTGNVVSATYEAANQVAYRRDRDIFVELPSNANDAKQFMDMAGSKLVEIDGKNYAIGEEAVNFSSFLGEDFKRPLKNGMINPEEEDLAIDILNVIIGGVIGKPSKPDELCVYSVPAEPIDSVKNVLYHQKTAQMLIDSHGYKSKPLNEATAIVYSELKNNSLTGIAISFGAGMINIAVSYKGLPVFSFSTARGGDWIDEQVKLATGKPTSEITIIKEQELDLTAEDDGRILQYLRMYYEELVDYTISNIIRKFEQAKRIPPALDAKNKNAEALPIVLAGGTSMPKGFPELFRDRIEKANFPFKISEILIASEPLFAVANGCLIYADSEEKRDTTS